MSRDAFPRRCAPRVSARVARRVPRRWPASPFARTAATSTSDRSRDYALQMTAASGVAFLVCETERARARAPPARATTGLYCAVARRPPRRAACFTVL